MTLTFYGSLWWSTREHCARNWMAKTGNYTHNFIRCRHTKKNGRYKSWQCINFYKTLGLGLECDGAPHLRWRLNCYTSHFLQLRRGLLASLDFKCTFHCICKYFTTSESHCDLWQLSWKCFQTLILPALFLPDSFLFQTLIASFVTFPLFRCWIYSLGCIIGFPRRFWLGCAFGFQHFQCL